MKGLTVDSSMSRCWNTSVFVYLHVSDCLLKALCVHVLPKCGGGSLPLPGCISNVPGGERHADIRHGDKGVLCLWMGDALTDARET